MNTYSYIIVQLQLTKHIHAWLILTEGQLEIRRVNTL